MKITYIASSGIPSQTANSVQVMKVCQALTQLGHSVQLIIPGKNVHAWEELEELYGVHTPFQITWLPTRNSMRKLDFTWAAVQQAGKDRAGLIYTRLIWGAVFAMQQKIPVILEMHEVPTGRFAPMLYRHYVSRKGQRLTVFITRALQNEIEKTLSVRHLPAETAIAPDGVDLERFTHLPSPMQARSQLGLKEMPTAVYSGGFYAGRGLEILFDLAAAFPQVQFIWIGGKPEIVAEWTEKVRSAGLSNVLMPGYIANEKLPQYLAAADILLMPYSLKVAGSSGGNIAAVTSPMKLFEYMACGRAILCSDLPVLHEVLNDKNALFYPPDDRSAMNAAFEHLLHNPQLRETLGNKALEDAAHYSWKARMQSILESFSSQITGVQS